MLMPGLLAGISSSKIDGRFMEMSEIGSKTYPNDECRVRQIEGIREYAHCRAPDSEACPYAISFGYGTLCHYPELQQIQIVNG